MTTKAEIVEAMARAVFEGMQRPRMSFSPEFEASVRHQCGRELDAALPLIREAMAEEVRDRIREGDPTRKATDWESALEMSISTALAQGMKSAARIIADWEPGDE